MSRLHVRHIEQALQRDFSDSIDLKDYVNASEEQRSKVFSTRALAALTVRRFSNLSHSQAAATVVDGTDDNGIDAIYLDSANSRILLVQSKWSTNGTSTLGVGDAHSFLAGFKDLTDERFDRFNKKIRDQQELISEALSDSGVKFSLIVATTGLSTLSDAVQRVFDDMLSELNTPLPLVTFDCLGVREFHSYISEGASGSSIDLRATVEQWGTVTEPYEAFYGIVGADVLGEWYEKYGNRLFGENIRGSLGNTEVNDYLKETLTSEASHFWYFNNGVTILCQKVERNAKGAGTRNYGEFLLSGASVVNGAQTVASIHRALKLNQEEAREARVWVRFISLQGCPPEFAKAVTRATNTQNSVEARDFVSLDPEQTRLRTDMLLSLNKSYVIKRGDQPPGVPNGCTVNDATIALACLNKDPGLAVLAKSAIGRLWESTDRPPYKVLFNSDLSAFKLWRSVTTLRVIEAFLTYLKANRIGREKSVAVQGNRIITHLVFQAIDTAEIEDPDVEWIPDNDDVLELTEYVLNSLTRHVESSYANNYLTSLFKNASRCRDLVAQVRSDMLSNGYFLGD